MIDINTLTCVKTMHGFQTMVSAVLLVFAFSSIAQASDLKTTAARINSRKLPNLELGKRKLWDLVVNESAGHHIPVPG